MGVAGGARIECSRGVQIIDFSPELGEAELEIHLNGVPYPCYGELFPQICFLEVSSTVKNSIPRHNKSPQNLI
jgi:hypothetical protein